MNEEVSKPIKITQEPLEEPILIVRDYGNPTNFVDLHAIRCRDIQNQTPNFHVVRKYYGLPEELAKQITTSVNDWSRGVARTPGEEYSFLAALEKQYSIEFDGSIAA